MTRQGIYIIYIILRFRFCVSVGRWGSKRPYTRAPTTARWLSRFRLERLLAIILRQTDCRRMNVGDDDYRYCLMCGKRREKMFAFFIPTRSKIDRKYTYNIRIIENSETGVKVLIFEKL